MHRHFLWHVSSEVLPINWVVYLLTIELRVLPVFWLRIVCQIHVLPVASPRLPLLIASVIFFEKQKFLILKYNLSIFVFSGFYFLYTIYEIFVCPGHEYFLLELFIVVPTTLRSAIYFMFILCLLWAKDPGSFPPTWTPGRPATLVVKAVLCPVVWPWRCCVVCVCMCSLRSNADIAALQGDAPQAPLSLPFSLVRRKSSLGFVGACDRFLTFSGGSAPGLRLFLTSLCWSLRLGCGSLQIPHLSSWGSSAGDV